VIGLWLLACGASGVDSAGPPVDSVPAQAEPLPPLHEPLDAPRLLRRLSLDLRGILPSVDELDRVQDDPASLAVLRDAYLEDPRFEERLATLLSERWHTLIDEFEVEYFDYDLDSELEYAFERAVGQEPLRLMARVAASDRPWSEIVTADWTVADTLLEGIWPLDRDPGEGWQVARYTDGRPAAGVLATNGLWWRYVTNTGNQNRSRAAAMTRLLLCEDYLARPVSFEGSVSLVDEDGAADAIRNEPSCQACHASLEPLAASMFGFWWLAQYSALEMTTYHAEREPLGPEILGVEPEWFGTPIAGLADMGSEIARDPRFYACTAESMAGLLWRRPVALSDFERIERFRRDFLDSDAQLKALIRAITDDDEYRAGVADPAEPDAHTTRMITATQLDSLVEELTGFRWTFGGYDLLLNDTSGYRVLAGGVDGYAVYRPQQIPGLTWTLVVRRVAEAAAAHVVAQELMGGERHLLCCADMSLGPEDAAFEEELRHLHWRLFARVPAEDRLDRDAALWRAVNDEFGAGFAWQALLTGLFRDPALWVY